MNDTYAKILPIVLDIEGVWSNNKHDRGQETVFGISRKWHPKEVVWHFVDALASKYGRGTPAFIKAVSTSAAIHGAVYEFYERVFWIPSHASMLPEPMDLIVFDLAVNSGLTGAAHVVEDAAIHLGHTEDTPSDLDFIKSYHDKDTAVIELLRSRKRYYQLIVKNNPKQGINFPGWMNRLRHIATIAVGSIPSFLKEENDNLLQ